MLTARLLLRRHRATLTGLVLVALAAPAALLSTSAAEATFSTVRLLPGGAAWTDPQGARWEADRVCVGGVVRSTSHRIAATRTPRLYQQQRTGVTGCRIPVRPGSRYRTTLYLAETEPSTSARRVFDVLAQGRVRVRALDIAARAGGPYRATRVSFDAQVSGSFLELAFRATSRTAKVSAVRVVEVRPSSGPASPSPSRPAQPSPSRTAAPAAHPVPSQAPSPSRAPAPPAADLRTPEPAPAPTRSAAPAALSPSPGPSYTLDSSYDRPSKDNPSAYRQQVDFNVRCDVVSIAGDDPIVYPGQPGRSHLHVFAGNTGTTAASTQDSLDRGDSSCRLDRDRAAYWFPQLFDEKGTALTPYLVRAYYRVGTLGTVATIPHGLRVIAGNSHATAPQNKGIAGWQCRSMSPDTQTVPKQSTIPDCPREDLLEGSVVFPNCWNGHDLDSADHASHLSYGTGDTCDSAHPVRLPQLTLAFRYQPGTTNSRSYLSAETSGLTLHADFWNAWDQKTLDTLVDRCLNQGVHCGDVSPKHFPGPMP